MFQYSPILGRSSIWDLNYTFSVFFFNRIKIIQSNSSERMSLQKLLSSKYQSNRLKLVVSHNRNNNSGNKPMLSSYGAANTPMWHSALPCHAWHNLMHQATACRRHRFQLCFTAYVFIVVSIELYCIMQSKQFGV